MIRAAALSFLILLFSHGAIAQDRVLPAPYRALWAAPSCAAPAQVLVTSAHFALSAGPDSARIDPLAVRAAADDYIKVEQGGENFFLALDTPESLTVTALKIRNGIWPERLDPFNPALSVRTFQKCAKAPAAWPSLHAEGLAAFAALDRLLRACAAPAMTEDCAQRLFEAADLNHDALLDYREMAIAYVRGRYLAATRPACVFADMFPGGPTAENVTAAGPAFAAAAVSDGDTDSDYRLSFAEITAAPPRGLLGVSGHIRALLPSLPASGSPFCAQH